MLHLWRGICYASNESEIKIKCPISPYLYQCSVSVFLITYCPVLSRWHLDTFQQFLLMVLRTHIKHSPSSLLSPAQHSTQLHSSHRCKVERVLSVEWATAWPPWWCHNCHKLQYFHPTRNPWLPGKIIKCVMTENSPKNECITPRSCWTKPLNVPRKDGNSWQMGLELG